MANENNTIVCDVAIIGAGLSGIGAAVHLHQQCPKKSFLVFEARAALGGTWDLFNYPGIRSDSDMHTLGFSFNPWPNAQAIADGPAIKRYIQDTAEQFGVAAQVRLNHRLTHAHWCSESSRWQLTIERGDQSTLSVECQFLFMGSGYYRYQEAYTPEFPAQETFNGEIIHPQFWPPTTDWRNKKVVVIGSGATAVTLVPALAATAAQVSMLQRSPSYIVARPAKDIIGNALKMVLPINLAYKITRWKNIRIGQFFNNRIRKNPARAKKILLKMMKKSLPDGFDMRHFTPSYNPWDQRICLAPDGDFFAAIKSGKANIVTDHIKRFVPEGILLKSGEVLPADIIVAATGLILQNGGGVAISVDDKPVHFGETVVYKGVMFSDVPNFVMVFGYTMSSWTLKADLAAQYFCRLINYLDEQGLSVATPQVHDGEEMARRPMLSFTSGYVQRASEEMPKQGDREPWLVNQNYLVDRKILLRTPIKDEYLVTR